MTAASPAEDGHISLAEAVASGALLAWLKGAHRADVAGLPWPSPVLTAAEQAQFNAERQATEQRALIAARLCLSVDDLNRQELANVAVSLSALSARVQDAQDRRDRIEVGLGLAPGSLKHG